MTVWNGEMPGCLGKECPTPCCVPKEKDIFDEKKGYFFQDTDGEIKYEGPKASYFTTLTQEEKDMLEKEGLEIETYPVLTKFSLNPVDGKIDRENRHIHALSDCLGSGGCSLGEKRPSICKIYPFMPYAENPLHIGFCPQIGEIVKHKENVVNAIKTMLGTGITIDVEKYIDELMHTLKNNDIQVSRTRREIHELFADSKT